MPDDPPEQIPKTKSGTLNPAALLACAQTPTEPRGRSGGGWTPPSVEEVQRKSRAYAAEQIERQKKDFIRLGVLGDWDHPYVTMNFRYQAEIARALGAARHQHAAGAVVG